MLKGLADLIVSFLSHPLSGWLEPLLLFFFFFFLELVISHVTKTAFLGLLYDHQQATARFPDVRLIADDGQF